MFDEHTRSLIANELDQARSAREKGMEGRARVLARRAAGIALRAYCASRGLPATGNAYDLIQWLQDNESMPADLRQIAAHLLTRVNEQYQLPLEVDLLAESEQLINALDQLTGAMDDIDPR